MRMVGTAFLALGLAASPAMAALPRAVLDSLTATPPPQARLDLNLAAPGIDGRVYSVGQLLNGRPAFIVFVDYTCNTLCGTDLMLLTDGIQRAGLSLKNYRILVIGIDPKDSARDAAAMEKAEIPPGLQPATTFLLPPQDIVKRASASLGFHYAYDAQTDQFAHPAVVYTIGPDGTVRGMLSPLVLTAGDLRQALQPAPAGFFKRISALCYAYDPLTGAYNFRVTILLQLAAMATAGGLALGIFLSARRRRYSA